MSCFYVLNFTPFASNLSYICLCGSVFGIRNQRGPEYGSNLDPDPQHCLEDTIQYNTIPFLISVPESVSTVPWAPQ